MTTTYRMRRPAGLSAWRSRRGIIGVLSAAALLASVAAPVMAPASQAQVPAPAQVLSVAPAPTDLVTEYTIPERPASAEDVTGGELHWAVRYSIRNYMENYEHTGGWCEASDGATYQPRDDYAVFPKASGWVDKASNSQALSFTGTFRIFGYGESWLWFTNVRLYSDGTTATLVAKLLEGYNDKTTYEDFVLATFAVGETPLQANSDATGYVQTSPEGRFSEDAYMVLPSMGGEPSYAPPNDYTDPYSVIALVDHDATVPPPAPKPNPKPEPQPVPNPNPAPVPGEDDDKCKVDTENWPPAPSGKSVGGNASSGATLTVTPGKNLTGSRQEVTLVGKGYPTNNGGSNWGGAYILFGWIDPAKGADWAPSQGGRTGFDYKYIQGQENQSMVSYPGNTTVDGLPVMDASGNWEGTFVIDSAVFDAFNSHIDCYEVQCGIITIGAHGKSNQGVEIFTPLHFAPAKPPTAPGCENGTPGTNPPAPGTDTPAPGDDPEDPAPFIPAPAPNKPAPNTPVPGFDPAKTLPVTNAAGTNNPDPTFGPNVNTGITDVNTAGRTRALLGVFIISLATLGLAALGSRRQRREQRA